MNIENAMNFITQVINKTDIAADEVTNQVRTVSKAFSQYTSTLKDLINAKVEYVNIIQKYLENKSGYIAPSQFPGLQGQNISTGDMIEDSQKMEELAQLVKDLTFQKDSIENQLEIFFKKVITGIRELEEYSNTAEGYLDDVIDEVGSVYGSPTMNSLVASTQQ